MCKWLVSMLPFNLQLFFVKMFDSKVVSAAWRQNLENTINDEMIRLPEIKTSIIRDKLAAGWDNKGKFKVQMHPLSNPEKFVTTLKTVADKTQEVSELRKQRTSNPQNEQAQCPESCQECSPDDHDCSPTS